MTEALLGLMTLIIRLLFGPDLIRGPVPLLRSHWLASMIETSQRFSSALPWQWQTDMPDSLPGPSWEWDRTHGTCVSNVMDPRAACWEKVGSMFALLMPLCYQNNSTSVVTRI